MASKRRRFRAVSYFWGWAAAKQKCCRVILLDTRVSVLLPVVNHTAIMHCSLRPSLMGRMLSWPSAPGDAAGCSWRWVPVTQEHQRSRGSCFLFRLLLGEPAQISHSGREVTFKSRGSMKNCKGKIKSFMISHLIANKGKKSPLLHLVHRLKLRHQLPHTCLIPTGRFKRCRRYLMIMIMIYIYIVPCIHWDHKVLYISMDKNILDNKHSIHHQITATSQRGSKLFRRGLLHLQRCSPFPLLWYLGCCTVIL